MDKPAPRRRSGKDQYLIAYNTLNAITWSAVLVRTLLLTPTVGPQNVYSAGLGPLLKWTQTTIFLEFLHVVLGLVPSNFLTTLIQVYSRLWVVWGIADMFRAPRVSVAYPLVAVAWSITEVVRYSYYVANIRGNPPKFLSWLRYNTFFILYPIGASSEWWLMYRALGEAKVFNEYYYYWILLNMAMYPFGFPNQYLHMISQRRKMMRGKKAVKKN